MSLKYLNAAAASGDTEALIRYVRLHVGDGDEAAGRREIDKAWVQALLPRAALLPRLAVDPIRPDVAEVELTTDLPSRTIALAWHRDREQPQSVRALIDVARHVCDQL
jgi:DNA-binding transcriptional LysR family regulator